VTVQWAESEREREREREKIPFQLQPSPHSDRLDKAKACENKPESLYDVPKNNETGGERKGE